MDQYTFYSGTTTEGSVWSFTTPEGCQTPANLQSDRLDRGRTGESHSAGNPEARTQVRGGNGMHHMLYA